MSCDPQVGTVQVRLPPGGHHGVSSQLLTWSLMMSLSWNLKNMSLFPRWSNWLNFDCSTFKTPAVTSERHIVTSDPWPSTHNYPNPDHLIFDYLTRFYATQLPRLPLNLQHWSELAQTGLSLPTTTSACSSGPGPWWCWWKSGLVCYQTTSNPLTCWSWWEPLQVQFDQFSSAGSVMNLLKKPRATFYFDIRAQSTWTRKPVGQLFIFFTEVKISKSQVNYKVLLHHLTESKSRVRSTDPKTSVKC